jgi:phosphoglycolate phosphatase-like HAD superfamily hydrolase
MGWGPVAVQRESSERLQARATPAGLQIAALPLRISADAVDGSKPDADPIEAALQRLHVASQEAVLLGDTPYDIAAGRKAGVATIALRCGGFSDQDLAGALALYDDPAALVADYTSQRAPFTAG